MQQAGALKDALTALNGLAQEAESHGRLDVTMTEKHLRMNSLRALIDHFAQAGVLTFSGSTLRFASADDRSFVKGGWLELHTMDALNQMHGPLGVRDKAIGLEVEDEKTKTKNELDVAFTAKIGRASCRERV